MCVTVCVCALTLPWELLSQLAQAAEAVCSQLAQDAWQHLRQLLGLGVARDGEGVGGERRLHFGVIEVDHCPIIFYHVHLQIETTTTTTKKHPVGLVGLIVLFTPSNTMTQIASYQPKKGR